MLNSIVVGKEEIEYLRTYWLNEHIFKAVLLLPDTFLHDQMVLLFFIPARNVALCHFVTVLCTVSPGPHYVLSSFL